MLCNALQCCAMLCIALKCFAVLYYTLLCYAIQYKIRNGPNNMDLKCRTLRNLLISDRPSEWIPSKVSKHLSIQFFLYAYLYITTDKSIYHLFIHHPLLYIVHQSIYIFIINMSRNRPSGHQSQWCIFIQVQCSTWNLTSSPSSTPSL